MATTFGTEDADGPVVVFLAKSNDLFGVAWGEGMGGAGRWEQCRSNSYLLEQITKHDEPSTMYHLLLCGHGLLQEVT